MITNLQNQSFLDGVKQRLKPNKFLKPQNSGDRSYFKKSAFRDVDKVRIVVEGQSGGSTIAEICEREGISQVVFEQWTDEFLDHHNYFSDVDLLKIKKELTEDEKFKIVIEGKSGETSIAEICRRENISHDTFLDWSKDFLDLRNKNSRYLDLSNSVIFKNKELISRTSNRNVFNYLNNYFDFTSNRVLVILKSNSLKLDRVEHVDHLIGLQKINDIRYINKYFEKVNSILPIEGVFAGCLETFTARRKRMLINKVPLINNIYFSFEFLFRRVLPKLALSKKYYFDITKGNDRLLSKAEGLGRLVSAGFKIMDYKSIDGMLYFIVKKVNKPSYDENPSYGPFYKMPRIGKNGKTIGVYKFRTMHPFSEYLQDYIVNANGYAETGKPASDFRIPEWGKFMRKYWLDELPQLLNVLKGEMKLVGIRPVSKRYFQDIPKEMQKLRLTQKPGCIPPYVALNRNGNVMSVLQAEKDYLEEKIQNSYFTDLKYFFKAMFNILFKNKRSA